MTEIVVAVLVFLGLLVTAIPGMIAAVNSISAKQAASTAKEAAATATHKIEQLSINVDGRLSLLMEKIEEAAFAKGREEGKVSERADVAQAAAIAGVAKAVIVADALTAETRAVVDDTHDKVVEIHDQVIEESGDRPG